MQTQLRIIVVAPDLVTEDSQDEHALSLIERSKTLRIGLLENGYNLIATLPADVFLAERIAQLQPDLIGGIRVVVGDEVLDTSVKARLEQMKVALTA